MCGTCGGNKSNGKADTATPADAQALQALINQFTRYGIHNLTINNYGSLSILGDQPTAASRAPGYSPSVDQHSGDVTTQGTWETASINIKNETGGFLRKVRLEHRFDSGGKTETITWENINSGQTTSSWDTSFWNGWGHGVDDWKIHIDLEEGGKYTFTNSGWKQCNLQEEDKKSQGATTFTLRQDGTLNIGSRSGDAETSYTYSNDSNVDAFGWIQIENNMSNAVSGIHLWHAHQGLFEKESVREYVWQDKVEVGKKTSPFPVYFSTSDTSPDKWNIELMRSGDKTVHKNSNRNKWCSLNSKDQGIVRNVIVSDGEWKLEFSDDPCSSGWDWSPASVGDAEEEGWTKDM